MFKFGFSSDAGEDTNIDESGDKSEKTWEDSKEFIPHNHTLVQNILRTVKFDTIYLGDVQIKYVCSSQVLDFIRNAKSTSPVSVLQAEQNHSDLLPAIYEGGFKIWECTYDLLKYIHESRLTFENKTVLDLGCGAGILGIYTLTEGSTCYFQDYNSDVLEYITYPNVLLNGEQYKSRVKFYSGDWLSFANFLLGNNTKDLKFDYILTSETIYNVENYNKLHKVFVELLDKNGTIYLAAKSFYFGVGGGISLFEDYIEKQQILESSSCWKCTEGVKREILKIQFLNLNECDP